MRYLLVLALLGLGGCATTCHHDTVPYDMNDERQHGNLNKIPDDAPTFERGF